MADQHLDPVLAAELTSDQDLDERISLIIDFGQPVVPKALETLGSWTYTSLGSGTKAYLCQTSRRNLIQLADFVLSNPGRVKSYRIFGRTR